MVGPGATYVLRTPSDPEGSSGKQVRRVPLVRSGLSLVARSAAGRAYRSRVHDP